MKGVAHEVFARADFNNPTAQVTDIIHGGLQRTIIFACDIRITMPYRDAYCGLGMKIVLGVLATGLVTIRRCEEC